MPQRKPFPRDCPHCGKTCPTGRARSRHVERIHDRPERDAIKVIAPAIAEIFFQTRRQVA